MAMPSSLAGDLPVRVELAAVGEGTYSFKITAGRGVALVHAARRPDSPVADAYFDSETPEFGALFWHRLASWLQVPAHRASRSVPAQRMPLTILSMGKIDYGDGEDWKALKLEMFSGSDYAAVFLNVAIEPDKGLFVEKDVEHRRQLIAFLRGALGEVKGLP